MSDKLTFSQKGDVPLGWIWTIASQKLGKRKIRALNLMGKEIVLFRDKEGEVGALDAYCPHMGAHLVDGFVDGKGLRCFFHNWKFDKQGKCIHIPCLDKLPQKKISIRSYIVQEKYGLIWLWTGHAEPKTDIPIVPELSTIDYAYSLGNEWRKKCHPNVVMINAIDEHHFQTVHKLPGHILSMQPSIENQQTIHFENAGMPKSQHWLSRMIRWLYKGPITYNLSYYCGNTGTVTLGPRFLRLYLMFTLREQADGTTIGKTIAFTQKRSGILGLVANVIMLQLTKIAGLYFAIGDTKVFQKIQFDFKNPIKTDKAVLAFIKHLENQPKIDWLEANVKQLTLKVENG